jgi:hypothetical protein
MIDFIKKIFNKLFGAKKEEKDPHLELYEDALEPEIKVLKPCENHGTYANRCRSCRAVNI